MDDAEQIKILTKSKQVNASWYLSEYLDVAAIGMSAAEHYFRYGARLGRKPRPTFDTKFYVDRYPDVAASGLNPAVHYALHGSSEERLAKASDIPHFREKARKSLMKHRRRLLSFGFTEKPIKALDAIARSPTRPFHATSAARELALWFYRLKTKKGFEQALAYALLSFETAQDSYDQARALTIKSLCLYHLGRSQEGSSILSTTSLPDSEMLDLYLTHANHQPRKRDKIEFINRALSLHSITPVELKTCESGHAYDHLNVAEILPAASNSGAPLISVLIACYNAEETLPTTLESLLKQTWRNFEAIIIDDASTDQTSRVAQEFMAIDRRVKLIEMPSNGGAYVARNKGLDAAIGEFVTIHDADDWSHPLKLQRQVEWLIANNEFVACTSQQARATNNLEFLRLTATSQLSNINMSSLMTRTDYFRSACGYWDTVRFGADTELLKRLNATAGRNVVQHLETGPLSFQRISETSIVADEFFGMEGFFFGARHLYAEAAAALHKRPEKLKYSGNTRKRPFPAPYPMLPDRMKGAIRKFDVIIASEFRMAGGSTRSSIEEINCQLSAGLRTGIFQMYRYDLETPRSIFSILEEDIDLSKLEILTYGEEVECDLLIIRYPPVLQEMQRYLPKVRAKNIKVILNQTPMSDYSTEGQVRFTLENAALNCRRLFGADAEWHPIGPLIRSAMWEHHACDLHYINLAEQDWHNIIDIKGWNRGDRTRSPQDKLRIGRHSRDAAVKWPAEANDILAAYPCSDQVDVFILGGAEAPKQVLGQLPPNWTVYPFGSLHPRQFLAEIDVFVYYHHPDWIEAFGRTIIEAMAVGVPVVLPHSYRPLFGEAALYATIYDAFAVAQRIHSDPTAYKRQSEMARSYAEDHFSYERHLHRLREAGIVADQ